MNTLLGLVASGPSGEVIARYIASLVLSDVNSACVLLYLLNRNSRSLVLIGHHGLTAPQARLYAVIPDSVHLPATRVLRNGTPHCASWHTTMEQHPLIGGMLTATDSNPWLLTVPLQMQGVTIGTITTTTPTPQHATSLKQHLTNGPLDCLALWAHAHLLEHGTPAPAVLNSTNPLIPTPRQRAITARIRGGHSISQIADELHTSISTVKKDIATISAVLGAGDRSALALLSARAGL